MKQVLVIAGPTASGKTAFSIRMAKLLDAKIISGDSIQVYRGLDIGSGKVTEEEKEGIPHSLIDILSPKDSFSAADFQRLARREIESYDGLSIICGGTGLYLKACLYDYVFMEEEGEAVAEELKQLDNETLYAMLKEADPPQAEKIHPNNRQRLLRSLSIVKKSGMRQSDIVANQSHQMVYDAFIAGCTMDRAVLYDRISRRVDGMFEAGLRDETASLLQQGVTFEDACMKGIGYREWRPYFAGQMTEDEVREEIKKHSRQFAKRQYTWLRHQMPVHWFRADDPADCSRMEKEILEWRNTHA
ncbi:MAG: tRNA (adenosine(37)-N6)-dimethylallyltransferase MiaA [Solobacterium sp.]|nr:tRNA (adenosine(37)-N6)-dimethylallyltransferase MiaA [Solobacterium sp.]